MIATYPFCVLLFFKVSIILVPKTEAEFKEHMYEALRGIQGYAIQIPVNHSRLQYFLNGGKTDLHQRFERDNGLKDDYNVFGNLDIYLQRNPEALTETEISVMMGPQNNIRSTRQLETGADAIEYSQTDPIPLVKLDFFVRCKPYSEMVSTSLLADDSQTFFTPSCMDIPVCKGCCGHKSCKSVTKKSKGFYYKTYILDYNNRIPTEHIRYFTITYDTACVSVCAQTPEDCTPNQYYDADLCKCTCGRVARCYQKTHYWSEEDCQCHCKEGVRNRCGAGEYLSHGDCHCHKLHRKF